MRRKYRLRVLSITTASVILVGAGALVPWPLKVVYNVSVSTPVGFYWIGAGPVRCNDYVAAVLPEAIAELAADRGYLPAGVPVIKRVAGVAGDEVCRGGAEVRINGALAAMAHGRDPVGRPLPVWHGCRVLGGDELFLLNAHPDSFDGRYFGPLPREVVIGRVHPLGGVGKPGA